MVLSQDHIQKMRNALRWLTRLGGTAGSIRTGPLLQYKSVELFIAVYTEELNNVNNYTGNVFNRL